MSNTSFSYSNYGKFLTFLYSLLHYGLYILMGLGFKLILNNNIPLYAFTIWSLWMFLTNLIETVSVKISVNQNGISSNFIFGLNSFIQWEQIEKIELVKKNFVTQYIDIYVGGKKYKTINNHLINFNVFCSDVLNIAKDFSSIEVNEKNI